MYSDVSSVIIHLDFAKRTVLIYLFDQAKIKLTGVFVDFVEGNDVHRMKDISKENMIILK